MTIDAEQYREVLLAALQDLRVKIAARRRPDAGLLAASHALLVDLRDLDTGITRQEAAELRREVDELRTRLISVEGWVKIIQGGHGDVRKGGQPRIA